MQCDVEKCEVLRWNTHCVEWIFEELFRRILQLQLKLAAIHAHSALYIKYIKSFVGIHAKKLFVTPMGG